MSNLVLSGSVIQPNVLKELFESHDREEAAIRKFANFADDHKDIIGYFTTTHGSYIQHLAREVFDYDRAKGELDATYWRKVIAMTEVLQVMPAKAREEMNEQIRNKEIVFTRDTVIQTIQGLLLNRGNFLADKVDGIHGGLSGKHVTNSPMAFRTRMIISRVTEVYGDRSRPSYMSCYRACNIIDDLRQVIAQIQGRDFKVQPHTSADVSFIVGEGAFGEWFHFDGGAFSMKIFKAGTAHLDVHPEIALKLNDILATKYPNVIADTKGKKAKKEFQHVELKLNFLSNACIQLLISAAEDLKKNAQTVYGYKFKDSQASEEAEKVFKFLGGKETKLGWTFEHDVYAVLRKVIMCGYLPDKVDHQFYPTPPELAKRMVEMADIGRNHTVLEPSAGQGGIAKFFPVKNNVHCVELNNVNCEILKSQKYVAVLEQDFLQMDEEGGMKFDRIVMNPPFHNGLAGIHARHATAMLKKKGSTLVCLMPANYKDNDYTFRHLGVEVTYSEVLEDQFEDAQISVVIAKAVRIR